MYLLTLLSLAFIAGLIIGGGTHSLYSTIRRQNERIRKLEQAGARRLPYKSADEIENGIAALLYTMQDHELRGDMLQNALVHLQKARNPELYTKK